MQKTAKRAFHSTIILRCGFVASLTKPHAVSTHHLQQAVASIAHRGPDAANTWQNSNKTVSLAHARLSIIDLSAMGNQPLVSVCNTIHCLVNGELYDFERIRSELQAKGHVFKTKSDSEIVINLYKEYGVPGMFAHLRGEFAFTLWDEKLQLLVAAKDRFGIKPLFYSIYENGIYLASEAKALFRMGVPCEWDEESVNKTLHLFGNRTLFKHVHQVPPGHYMLVSPSNVQHYKMVKYWDWDFVAKDAPMPMTEQQVIGKTRELLEESVRLRLRADVPVGVYLSGGIDSCAVLGLANNILRQTHQHRSIDAFTLSFDHASYDEGAIAEKQAKFCNAKFHKVNVTQAELAHGFEDAVYHSENLQVQANFVAKFLLSRAVHNAGYKVVLTGEGSDEVMAGYPWFKLDYVMHDEQFLNKPEHERKQIIDAIIAKNHAVAPVLTARTDTPITALMQRYLGTRSSVINMENMIRERVQPFLHKPVDILESSRYKLMYLDSDAVSKMGTKWNTIHTSMYIWAKSMLQNCILTALGDRMEMAHSIEGRVPFLDHVFVEFMNSIPLSMKLKLQSDGSLVEKYVLREATKDVLIPEVYTRMKHPFTAPPATFKQGPLYKYHQEILRSSVFARQPFVDQKRVVKLLDDLHVNHEKFSPAQLNDMDTLLMYLSCMAVIQKRYF